MELNMPSLEGYYPRKPRMMKIRVDEKVTVDLFIYIDDNCLMFVVLLVDLVEIIKLFRRRFLSSSFSHVQFAWEFASFALSSSFQSSWVLSRLLFTLPFHSMGPILHRPWQ